MKTKTVLFAIVGLSMAAVLYAQTSQSNQNSQQTSQSGTGRASASSSSSSSASSSGSKSSSAFASGSKNANSSSRGGGSGSGSGVSFSGKPTHAILYSLDRNVDSAEEKQQAFALHLKYMGDQQGKGKVVLFGLWRDLPGSMAILVANSDEEANEIAKNDPAVKAGSLTYEVRAWTVMIAGSKS